MHRALRDKAAELEPTDTQDVAAVRLALGLLSAVFTLRVLVQLVQTVLGVDQPVPLARWDSGTIPYGALLASQVAVIAVLVGLVRKVDDQVRPSAGRLLGVAGWLYLVVMMVRMGIGSSGISAHRWFEAPVPTSFHFVLAGFLIILGHHWRGRSQGGSRWRRVVRRVVYPMTVGGGLVLFGWSQRAGVPASVAAYHAVILAGAAIAVAEVLLPYRDAWRPDRRTMRDDGLYLAVVQILMPALLSAAVVAGAGVANIQARGIWPHGWPVAVQVIAMLLVADFLRYWLHRASHAWPVLWRLHAVHHSPEGLYVLNVGRFHPIEKALQFVLDALPFVLLGVSQEVLAGYLVFFAINGFFQHSNVDLRLGWLNWVVSGAELHRWHHARDAKLSGHNYGNNFIVWDVLFGTRLLPADRQVDELGLNNRAYPQGLLGQAMAPFSIDPNGSTVR